MTLSFALRDATDADFALLQRLHYAGMKSYVTQLLGWDDEVQMRILRERFDPRLLSVIRCEDRDVGILQVTRTPAAFRLDNILIDPAYQRRGMGTAVLAALIAESKDRGGRLALSVLRPNPARALYERAGFVVVREDDARIEMAYRPDGAAG
jgi:GNAT superfamily N-acetyltransferase